MIDAASCHAAVDARDKRFDGVFFTGVKTTGIYCRCVCPARAPKRENRIFYASAAAAEKAGFRPCLVCRPECAPGAAPIDQGARIAAQALARIEAGALETHGLAALARDIGVTPRHLRRVVQTAFGAAPIDLAQTHRLLTAKRLLTETSLPVTEVAFASGFQSVRRFNAVFRERYGFPPTRIRARRAAPGGELTLDLDARGPFDAEPLVAFMRQRALIGMEHVEGGVYARTLMVGAARGWVRIGPRPDGLRVSVSDGLAPALRSVLASVRGAFDLDTDVEAVDAMLSGEPRLRVDADPRVRIPGCLDPFETAVRAILGQQVTVTAAKSLAQRLVDLLGEPIETGDGRLRLLFPSPEAIAEAGAERIAALGMPRARALTVQRLAEAVAGGRLSLARGAWTRARAELAALPGIGPWTVEYIALRGLGDPDAFPATDSAIRGALALAKGAEGEIARRAGAWRPWRSYATVRLWRAFAARGEAR